MRVYVVTVYDEVGEVFAREQDAKKFASGDEDGNAYAIYPCELRTAWNG